MSPLVRLGTDRSLVVLKAATALPHAIIVAAVVSGLATGSGPLAALTASVPLLAASLFVIPSARNMLCFAEANHKVPDAIAPLKIFATKLHMAWGFSLVLGLALGNVLTRISVAV